MSYTKTTWVNNTTPINETNLNKIESGIKNNDINIGEENYDNTRTYEVGDIVRYNEKIYKCITAITTAENFDISKWEQTNIVEIVQNEKSKIYELIEALSTPIVGEGENITLNDTAEKRFENFDIEGNSEQATRSGKNLLELMEGTYSDRGITAVVKNGIVTLNGTATGTSFVGINLLKNFNLITENAYRLSAFNTEVVGNSSDNLCSLRLNGEGTKETTLNKTNSNKAITGNFLLTYITIRTAQGITYNNFVIKPQLELGNGTDTWEQGGVSPSPDYQSPVKTVGSNMNLIEETFKGYNLNGNGAFEVSSGFNMQIAKVKANVIYTLNTKTNVLGYYNEKPTLTSVTYNKSRTVLPGDANTIVATRDGYIAIRTIDAEKVKCVEGTEVGEYSKHGQGCINEVICNKNLFNVSVLNDYSQNGITLTKNEGTNKIKLNGTPTKDFTIYSKDLDVNMFEIGEKYSLSKDFSNITFNFEVFENNSNTASIWATSITMQKSYTRVRVYVQGKANTTFNNQEIALQLEKGNATEIVAHKSQTYTIPTQQEMLKGDYFDWDNEEEVHTWNKLVLDGTENWEYDSTYNYFKCPSYVFEQIPSTASGDGGKQLSNYFSVVGDWNTFKNNTNLNGFNPVSNLGYKLIIRNTNCRTIDTFKAWLKSQYDAGTPVTIYYKLATPTRLPFTDEQKAVAKKLNNARTYKNVTNIYSTDEVSPNCYVEAAKDLTTLIQ